MKKPKRQKSIDNGCLICGKPSPETICERCKTKIQAENIRRKIQADKAGKD